MDAARTLIRFSIPGGFAILLAITYQVVIAVATGASIGHILEFVGDKAVALAAGSIVLGFAIYQMYYAFCRPYPLGRIRIRRLRMSDRGGQILDQLSLPVNTRLGSVDAIRRISNTYAIEAELLTKPGPDLWKRDPQAFNKRLHQNNGVVRSLVSRVADDGGEHVKREYMMLSDIYHALGACRGATIAIGILSVFYACVLRPDRWVPTNGSLDGVGTSQADCLAVAASGCHVDGSRVVACFVIAGLTFVLAYILHRNRNDARRTLTNQLGRDLRAWWTTNPGFLR